MFHKQISRGIDLLDSNLGPTWVSRINLDNLAISKSDRCVLGQLGGYYWMKTRRLGLTSIESSRHGFTFPHWLVFTSIFGLVLMPLSFLILTREWKKEIRLLQMEHGRMRPDVVERRQHRMEGITAPRTQDEYDLAAR